VFWRVLARFDVFVMPFWGAPGEFALSTTDGHRLTRIFQKLKTEMLKC
jgi:hypothetical protein